jgi:hypothetical protein
VAGVEEIEGPRVDWVMVGGGREVMLETVDTGNTTEESGRLGSCPGYVRTGSSIPTLAQLSIRPSRAIWAEVKSVTFAAVSTHATQLKYELSKEATQHTAGVQV